MRSSYRQRIKRLERALLPAGLVYQWEPVVMALDEMAGRFAEAEGREHQPMTDDELEDAARRVARETRTEPGEFITRMIARHVQTMGAR